MVQQVSPSVTNNAAVEQTQKKSNSILKGSLIGAGAGVGVGGAYTLLASKSIKPMSFDSFVESAARIGNSPVTEELKEHCKGTYETLVKKTEEALSQFKKATPKRLLKIAAVGAVIGGLIGLIVKSSKEKKENKEVNA